MPWNLPRMWQSNGRPLAFPACLCQRQTGAKIEAFNATIGRIVRRACGYRDLEYLYLKIRQEALTC